MIKKLVWLAVIFLLLLLLGGLIYWKTAKRPAPVSSLPPRPAPAEKSPRTAHPSPANPSGDLPAAGPAVKKESAPPAEVFAPRPGETLEYDATVTQLNSTVANLKLTVNEKRPFGAKPSWHFQAFAHTENPYRMVFELDDQFDSYSDARNMTSLQYEMHLNERGQKVDSVQRLLPSVEDPPPDGTSAARVLPGTRDPLGLLQFLRGVDWSKTPEVRSPVYDGRKLYDTRATVSTSATAVIVPAGKFTATKIEIRVFDNGTEMKDAHFFLYLANDTARTPVLMEAVLPVATARVELTRAK
jgi:hypothetical protein